MFKINLQLFSEEESGVNESAAAEQTTETTTETQLSQEETGVETQSAAETNEGFEKAFAARLKDATAKERDKARDELIAEMYGETYGIRKYAEYQKAVEQQRRQAEVQQYANDNGMTEEEAKEKLEDKQRLQSVESELKLTKRMMSLDKEKAPHKDKKYFKELEAEVDQLVIDNAQRGVDISWEAAFTFIRGGKVDEFENQAVSSAVKSTVANIHDRAKRGVVSADGNVGEDVDTSDVNMDMAKAFGTNPTKIAKYVKQQLKGS